MKILELSLMALAFISCTAPSFAMTGSNIAACDKAYNDESDACVLEAQKGFLICAVIDPFGKPDNPDSCQGQVDARLRKCMSKAMDKYMKCLGQLPDPDLTPSVTPPTNLPM